MVVPRSIISLFSKNSSSSLIYQRNFNVYFSTSVQKEQPFTKIYELLKNKHNFSEQAATHVASASYLANYRNPQQNADSVLNFLKENNFSLTQLEKIMRSKPQCLTCKVEVIKPKITTLQDMGFSANVIAEIITQNPVILCTSLKNRIIPSLSVLKGLLGSSVEIAMVLRKPSYTMLVDLEKNLLPNIEFLKSCGIAMNQITHEFKKYPRIFLCNPEDMEKFVDKVDELGVDKSMKTYMYAVRVVSSFSGNNLELRFKAFLDLGFSENDILKAFRASPQVFSTSEDKIKKVKEVLLGTKKYEMSCIAKTPISLMYSVETRYKPRLQVLEILEKKNLIEKWPTLPILVTISNEEFRKRFVNPFSNKLSNVKLMIEMRFWFTKWKLWRYLNRYMRFFCM